ncbi:hypothetical protein [Cohnella silvisoli]|uniref:DUF3899 domain-containing protein n=1 Tax=Cohnella silvisoli TaxID=2873699 RepID=A0ABV1KQR8_9BACL|nr:hypothetical protein [Cohnella silvisoli]MCD9025549.1 hypothetical protein [Cohnella silvisoli]
MQLRLATILALIGSIMLLLSFFFLLLLSFDAFSADSLDSVYKVYKWTSVLDFLAAITLINFFLSFFLLCQSKRKEVSSMSSELNDILENSNQKVIDSKSNLIKENSVAKTLNGIGIEIGVLVIGILAGL